MSARGVALLNASTSSLVFALQLFFPRRFYGSHVAAAVAKWTGWVRPPCFLQRRYRAD